MKKEKKYSKQRNYCLFVKKNKTNYCSNFNEINVNDTSQKVYVFAKITPYMCISKRKLLINAFFKARFSYCPPAWVCYSCLMNNKINKTCPRIICHDKALSFVDFFKKYGFVTIRKRNMQALAIEIFKVYKKKLTECRNFL